MKTVTLTPKYGSPNYRDNIITNCDNKLVVTDVTTYRVGNKLVWIEYNNGKSIIAVRRDDYATMVVSETTDVILHGIGFERINCESYHSNRESSCDF